MIFIDFTQAFDCIKIDQLPKDMRKIKIPETILIELLEMSIKNSTAKEIRKKNMEKAAR